MNLFEKLKDRITELENIIKEHVNIGKDMQGYMLDEEVKVIRDEINKGFKSIEEGHFVDGKIATNKFITEAENSIQKVNGDEVCDNCLHFGEYVEYNQAICDVTKNLCHRLQKCGCRSFISK